MDAENKAARIAREAEGYFELQLFEDCLERANVLLKMNLQLPFARSMRAECLRSLDRFEDGEKAYELILTEDPGNVAAWVGLGWCRKRNGRLDLAMASMEDLLRHRPGETIGLYNLACYCVLGGERERALDLLRQAVTSDPSYRLLAREEEDFDSVRNDPAFRELIEEEPA
jgi:tetratricopeptide (TPR) repeat protein